MLIIFLEIGNKLTHLIATYACDMGKSIEEYALICEQLQNTLNDIPTINRIIIMEERKSRKRSRTGHKRKF